MSKPKLPTDAKILEGFQSYEEGMNVLLALLRDISRGDTGAEMDTVFAAHDLYRQEAIAARERLDRKAEKKDRGK